MAAPAFQLLPDQWDMDSVVGQLYIIITSSLALANIKHGPHGIIGPILLIIYLHDIEPLAEHIIVHYRFIFVMFLLPVSFLYDIWFYTRNKIVFAMSSAPTKHKEKVLGIQRQVNSCNIFTSRTETKIFRKTLKTKTLKKDKDK